MVFPPEPYAVVDEDQRAGFFIDRVKYLHQAVGGLNLDSPPFLQFLHKIPVFSPDSKTKNFSQLMIEILKILVLICYEASRIKFYEEL